jgi:hypothetical protein
VLIKEILEKLGVFRMVDIHGEDYKVTFDPVTATVTCQGAFRLYGATGYEEIEALLDHVADQKAPVITLNLKELEFLNSSGINAFSKFLISVRHYGVSQVIILGNADIAWQVRSIENLQRLMPTLQVQFN